MSTEHIVKKLVLVGDGACGKTYLIHRFRTGELRTDFVPTVLEGYSADMQVGDKMVELNVWDTTGSDDYERLRQTIYPDTDVFLLCFSISSPSSFCNISTIWLPEVKRHCPNIPFILVGTQTDLATDPETLLEWKRFREKPITLEKGRDLANKIKAVTYLECSAKTGEGVKEVFDTAVNATFYKKERKKCNLL